MKRKQIKKGSGMTAGICMGAVISMITTLIGSMVIAKMIDMGLLTVESTHYPILAMAALSAWLGTNISIRKTKNRKWIVCMLCQAVYLVGLMITTILFYDGLFDAQVKTIIAVAVGGIMGAVMKERGRTPQIKRKVKFHTC